MKEDYNGILKKNQRVEFSRRKKHWAEVIKNTGSGDLLIWRRLEEDFNTNSTFIVMPGEAAIFVKGIKKKGVTQSA